MEKITIKLLFVIATLLFGPVAGWGGPAELTPLLQEGLAKVGAHKGEADLCVLTNANYVRLNGETTEAYVDVIAAATGCSIGKRNLLFVNLRESKSLLTCLLNRRTGQCFIIREHGARQESELLAMSGEDLRSRGYLDKASRGLLGADTFSVTTILGSWYAGAPFDLLRCGEVHGHICPGMIMGYLAAKAIPDKYPLRDDEKYLFIASPNACKEDAFMMLLGITPGSTNLVIKPLVEGQVKENEKIKLMGILIKWSPAEKQGEGVVIGLNKDALYTVTKFDKKMGQGLKLLAIFDLIKYLPNYADFFVAIREFPVTGELKQKLFMAGVNPYEVLGMTK